MKLFKFKKEPLFAELWDVCLHNLLYNKNKYVSEIMDLFKKNNINKKSKLLDTSAGGGFIALYLRQKGYDIDCMDLMDDEIQVFKKRAKKLKISTEIKKISWKQIPKNYKKESYDFLFCRGNSFIYADGGWNKKQTINEKSSLDSYRKTLENFYNVLKKGGYLYIDKFPDNEKPHKDVTAQIKVGKREKEDLIFYTKKIPSRRYREAMMIRRTFDGKETGLPNITFDLKEKELEKIMKEVGFKVKKINLKSETHFRVWLARK